MRQDQHSNTPARIYLTDYKAPDFQIKDIHLYFNLHETQTVVTAKMNFAKSTAAKDLVLTGGEHVKLLSLSINGEKLAATRYQVEGETLTIKDVPSEFLLESQVEINPEANKSCEGLYLSGGIFCTQCEAESFRKITYFLDRPDVMTSYTVEIEADEKKYPHLLSNGDNISKKSLGNGRHHALWKDPFKKPSYLFALVAGDMGVITDTFKTKSGKTVKLEVYAPHGKQERCKHAMVSLQKSMQWDEERWGLEYDLNTYMIVSIDDFNMGAMENKGLNVFNSRLVLADEKSATDTDFEMIESVVGHEYFHNWTGNRVTCRNWFELSLKEGLTVFRDQEFSADMNSRPVQRIKDVDSLRTRQFTEDAGPNAHPVRPESCLAVDNFYTATIYEKGAEVIRMMQTIVGRDGFRKGMDEYFKRHDGQAVTIIDFADAIATPNKADFSQFKLWYSQAGTPNVSVSESFDQASGTLTLTLSQESELTVTEKAEGKTKLPFHIPLKFGLIDASGKEISEHNQVLHLKEKTQTWTFKGLTSRPVVSLNREFSAPVKLKWNRSNADLLHLIKFDTDAFNRRESCSKMLFDETQALIADFQNKKDLVPQTEIINALGTVLKDEAIDPQFKALILAMPSDSQLAQEQATLDPQAFFQAKLAIRKAFANTFHTELVATYKKHNEKNSIGDRALKNRILGFGISTEKADWIELASTQYASAKNMTDKISALSILCEVQNPATENALKDFHATWSTDSVVFNKWLSVQATSSSPMTFERVQAATKAKGYDQTNPNNMYSLHGGFAGNYLRFHTDSAETYKWYADELLRIDKVNPQVGARLAQAFTFTKKLPANLKTLAQAQVQRMLATDTLSKNARELLEKTM
ncbi:MAG: aminopeptidase N [Pseudobdellovibrio sp.]|nr:aminopeptidase N [Pseudobdellovibrio sp.]